MLRNLKNLRIQGMARIWFIAGLAFVEVIFAGLLWVSSKPEPEGGFLIKMGGEYLIAWKNEGENDYDSAVYNTLKEALDFVREELHLFRTQGGGTERNLEYAAIQDRYGTYVFHWKFLEAPFLHQLTFNSYDEAQFFIRAFRQGSYSPSPFGHSITFATSNHP